MPGKMLCVVDFMNAKNAFKQGLLRNTNHGTYPRLRKMEDAILAFHNMPADSDILETTIPPMAALPENIEEELRKFLAEFGPAT